MKILYFIISIVLLNCSCHWKNTTTVSGVLLLDKIETVPSFDGPLDAIAEIPDLSIQPVAEPVNANDNDSSSSLALLLSNPIRLNENSVNEPKILPVLTSITNTAKVSTDNTKVHANLINPKCNTIECPKYKCVTYLIPANLTAGECCGHCAPVSVKPTTTTTTKKTSVKPQKTQSSSSASASASASSSEKDSSSEEKPFRCSMHSHKSKPYRNRSYLIRKLTAALDRCRHSQRRYESEDDE